MLEVVLAGVGRVHPQATQGASVTGVVALKCHLHNIKMHTH